MKALFSLLLHRLPFLLILFTVNALVPSTALAYDAQPQPSMVYDGVSLPALDYDSRPAFLEREKENPTTGIDGVFGLLEESFAAKEIPPVIYRGGKPSPSNLKLRPGEEALSFRDSLSNPLPKTERPVFRPGDDFHGIDTSKLPPGSVVPDNIPPGHVSVQGVTHEQLQQAVIERGKFPK